MHPVHCLHLLTQNLPLSFFPLSTFTLLKSENCTYYCQILIISKSCAEPFLRYRVQVQNPKTLCSNTTLHCSSQNPTTFVSPVPLTQLSITTFYNIYLDQVNQDLSGYCKIDLWFGSRHVAQEESSKEQKAQVWASKKEGANRREREHHDPFAKPKSGSPTHENDRF